MLENNQETLSKTEDGFIRAKSILPEFKYSGISDVLKSIENLGRPRNALELISRIDVIIGRNMRYDALNYALIKNFPSSEKEGGWIDLIDIKKVGLNTRQKSLLLNELTKLEKGDMDSSVIKDLKVKLEKDDISGFVEGITNWPSLQQYFLYDSSFTEKWMKLYEGETIGALIRDGIGQCKTFSVISKMLIESGNIRWNLGIKKVIPVEGNDGHVTLEIITHRGDSIKYDPTKNTYN